MLQYDAYNSLETSEVPSISATPDAVKPVAPPVQQEAIQQEAVQQEGQQEIQQEKVISEQAGVSAPPQEPPPNLPIVSKEERIEYRDENGRILDEDEVSALAGKVSFKTRYETRTRVVNAEGEEIYEGLVEAHEGAEEAGVAPPHPDVEGRNPETQEAGEVVEPSEVPPTVEVVEDQIKEQSIEAQKNDAKPASEQQAATQE